MLRKMGIDQIVLDECHGYNKGMKRVLDEYISQKGHFDPLNQLAILKRKTEALQKVNAPIESIKKVQRDIKFSSQIASRLVTSVDKMPQIKIGSPLDNVEIVPNLKMLFLSKVKGLPSPLLLKITYLNNSPKRLVVATTLTESDAKDIVYSDKVQMQNMTGGNLA